jgi:hypothetical protein
MGPLILFSETRKEAGGSNSASLRAANIGDIGKVTFQQFVILFIERQTPSAITTACATAEQLLGELIIIG